MKRERKPAPSAEHQKYLRRLRREDGLVGVSRIGLLLALLGIWELVAAMQWVDPFIISSPSRIARTIAELAADGSLFYHIGTTLWETLAGFAIAVTLGTAIALLLWWSERARRILEPYIVVLNSLPKIALGPVLIVWFGTGAASIVFMTVLVGIIVATLNMLGGFLATDKNKILLLRSMGASKRADPDQTRASLRPARLHRDAESVRGHGVDRLDHGRIHRLEGGAGLPDRVRRAGVPLRPRDGRHRHPLRAGGRHVRPRRARRAHPRQKIAARGGPAPPPVGIRSARAAGVAGAADLAGARQLTGAADLTGK